VVVEEEPLRTLTAWVCALLALLPAVTCGQGYRALGACRAGVPNGAYELRDAGTLRVVGAFAQGRLTGTFIFWTAAGARVAVLPFDNNVKNGTVALWYVTPEAPLEAGRKLEAPYVDDRPHGVWRAWHPDGALRAEYRYEHGVLADARAWTDAGEPLSEATARGQAAGDAEADEQLFAALLGLVAANRPACD
jgi:hypothetical protein